MSRENNADKLVSLVEDGVYSWESVARMLIIYNSDDENGLVLEQLQEETE